MALNLVRNSRIFFTTNVDTNTGVIKNTDFTVDNTREIQVLDGFSFTQNTTAETVTLNETGSAPNRGQRSFNTALEPAEVTMSTYIRPEAGTTNVECEESVLWESFAWGKGETTSPWTAGATGATAAGSVLDLGKSEQHQMRLFGLIITVDNVTYLVNNCAVDQAVIDFGIDAIATIAWTIRGSTIKQATAKLEVDEDGDMTGMGLTGTTNKLKLKDTDAAYIANKLSTVTMKKGIDGSASGAEEFDLPITGGSITFANNITYLTPANLGIVNQPITYFTGTRAVSGSITAYLRTGGTNDTGSLLDTLLTNSATDITPAYKMTIAIGGKTNGNRVDITIPAAVLTIPTVSVEQVVSTTINFTGHGTATATDTYDLEQANEATITYHAVA